MLDLINLISEQIEIEIDKLVEFKELGMNWCEKGVNQADLAKLIQ